MKKKKLISILMTAVLTFTSVAPQSALYANAEGDVIVEEISEEDAGDETVSNDEAEEDTLSDNTAEEESILENECVSGNDAESISEDEAASVSENEAVSENEVYEETVSGNAADEKELPAGIKGMPEGYALSEREAEIKADMINHDVLVELKNAVAGVDYVEDQVYCVAETEEYAQQIAEAYGIELVEYNYQVAIFSTKDSVMEVPELVEISADPDLELPPLSPNYLAYENKQDPVEYAQINSIDYNAKKNETLGWEEVIQKYIPNRDPYLYPDNASYQWWHDMMDTYPAWGAYRGVDFSDSGISVAIIGSGIDVTHEELQGHTNVVNISSGTDRQGTQVAGIIGATANNGKGGAGVAPGVQLIGYNTDMSSTGMVQALNDAVANGRRIVCISDRRGGYNPTEFSAINAAYEAGVTMLAPAGDESANNTNYPAQYDHVIAVGAVQQDGKRASFSTYGKGIVDVYAPGVEMSDLSIAKAQGSSMACAAAAGACALYMSIMGPVDPDRMSTVLTNNTVKCSSNDAGAGIVNIARMLEAETTAPIIRLYKNDGTLIKEIDSGKSGDVTTDTDAYLQIIPITTGNEENKEKDNQIFFSLTGRAPAFDKYGYAEGGTFLTNDGKVSVLGFYNQSNDKKEEKMIVKACCVSGMGVTSKVTTISVIIRPIRFKGIHLSNIPKGSLAEGASWQLYAYLDRPGIMSHQIEKCKWEITSGNEIATISSKGLVKAKKGKSGEVAVRCSYTEAGVTKEATTTLTIADRAQVKSFKVSDSKVKLSFKRSSDKLGLETSKIITVSDIINTKNEDITASDDVYFYWETSNYPVVRVDYSGNGKEATLVAKQKGTATITCKVCDGSNKKIKIKVRVISLVDNIYIYGQSCIAAGSSAKYKATVVGVIDYAMDVEYKPDDKRIIWSISQTSGGEEVNELPGVKIDPKSGKVTVTAKNIDSFYVVATANDGGGAVTTERIRITDKKTGSIVLKPEEDDSLCRIQCDKKGSLKKVQLYTVDVQATTGIYEDALKVKAVVDTDTPVKWKSSNEKVAGIGSSGDTVWISAYGAGTSRITCTADDGSGRKASFIVKVIVPVSNLMLSNETLITQFNKSSNEPYSRLGVGNTTKTKVTVGDTYGKPAKVKVTWDYELVEAKWDGASSSYIVGALTDDELAKAKAAKLYSGSNGKLSFRKDYAAALAAAGLKDVKLAVRLTATATDGSNIKAKKLFIPSNRVERMWFTDKDGKELKTIEVKAKDDFGLDESILLGMKAEYSCIYKTEKETNSLCDGNVSSSDTAVATAYLNDSGDFKISYGKQKGTATITCKAVDGSGKKCTIKVIVK